MAARYSNHEYEGCEKIQRIWWDKYEHPFKWVGLLQPIVSVRNTNSKYVLKNHALHAFPFKYLESPRAIFTFILINRKKVEREAFDRLRKQTHFLLY